MNRPLPADAIDGHEAAAQLGIKYSKIRYWWQHKRIGSWKMGGYRRYVSLEEVRRYHQAMQEPHYTGPPVTGESAEGSSGAEFSERAE